MTSAEDIFRAFPMVAVLMTVAPWRKVVEAAAIMTVKTKMHSSKVVLKCLGRAFGSGGIKTSAISASTSKLPGSE